MVLPGCGDSCFVATLALNSHGWHSCEIIAWKELFLKLLSDTTFFEPFLSIPIVHNPNF
jgi:hypothetical protein